MLRDFRFYLIYFTWLLLRLLWFLTGSSSPVSPFGDTWGVGAPCYCWMEVGVSNSLLLLLLSHFSPTLRPHGRQPSRLLRPWDSPGRSIGVGCHCLLQCMEVKSESEVAQSCPTLCDPMDCSLPGSPVPGALQARVLEWGATAFSRPHLNLPGRSVSLQLPRGLHWHHRAGELASVDRWSWWKSWLPTWPSLAPSWGGGMSCYSLVRMEVWAPYLGFAGMSRGGAAIFYVVFGWNPVLPESVCLARSPSRESS